VFGDHRGRLIKISIVHTRLSRTSPFLSSPLSLVTTSFPVLLP
jgi:hypothetical protein